MRHSLKPRALADICHAYGEGVERFGIAQAEAYSAGLHDAFAFLSEFPRAARLRAELNPPVRAYAYRSHVIIYDLGPDDRIVILRVRHYREDWSADPVGD